MEKYITFAVDDFDKPQYKMLIFPETTLCYNYDETTKALERKDQDIWTYNLTHLSFDLLDMGYNINIAYKGKILTCYPGMITKGGKNIRRTHNLLKLLLDGYFHDDFNDVKK